jgi:hypothetical protein
MMLGIILDKLGAGKARSLLNLHRYNPDQPCFYAISIVMVTYFIVVCL